MATAVTKAGFVEALTACGDAIIIEDWRTARLRYAQAAAIHAGLNTMVEDEQTRMERVKSLSGLKEAIDSAQAATGGTAASSNQVSFTRGIPR